LGRLATEFLTTRGGIKIDPDTADWQSDAQLAPITDLKPAQALDRALAGISDRYGVATARLVAMQLEYPAML